MREILSIHVGQCGNQIGEMFWELALKEHGLDENGSLTKQVTPAEEKAMEVFFHRLNDNKYTPRAVLIDLEPGVISRIEEGQMANLYDQSNIIKKIPGAANNWARGYKIEGEKVIAQIMNVIDANVEMCESLQGFVITHSIGGGSGSGLGSLIVKSLRETYPNKKIFTFSVAPSPLISDSAIEPYNAILTLNQLKENADAVILLDNDTLFRIALRQQGEGTPNYMDLNRIISLAMSSVTASLRFPGNLNTDLGELLVNLVPFPGNHFLTPSFAPLGLDRDKNQKMDFGTLVQKTFSEDNFCADVDFEQGVFLSVCALFRGHVTAKEVEDNMTEVRRSLKFASYVPTGVKIGVTSTASEGFSTTGLALANHTGVCRVLERLLNQFDMMYQNDAFTHWYENNSVSKEELNEARNSVAQLVESYRQAA